MNRRFFIRALAGLAAMPLIGRFVKVQPEHGLRDAFPTTNSFQVYDKQCPYDFSQARVLTDAELRRRQLLGYLRRNEYVDTTGQAVSRIFADFDYNQIDAFCDLNGLAIEARRNGLIRISMPWRTLPVYSFTLS